MSEPNQNRNNSPYSPLLLNTLKTIIVLVFIYPVLHYTLQPETPSETIPFANVIAPPLPAPPIPPPAITKPIVKQPSCPPAPLRPVLERLIADHRRAATQCTPADVHNAAKHRPPGSAASKTAPQGEARATIVGCVAAGLLLTSLGAACVELYRAKRNAPVKAKQPASRKCSLADLTVLKHARKELVRRESLMEIAENGTAAIGRKVTRPPLRLD